MPWLSTPCRSAQDRMSAVASALSSGMPQAKQDGFELRAMLFIGGGRRVGQCWVGHIGYSIGKPAWVLRESSEVKPFASDGIATSAIVSGVQPPWRCTMRTGRMWPYSDNSPAR